MPSLYFVTFLAATTQWVDGFAALSVVASSSLLSAGTVRSSIRLWCLRALPHVYLYWSKFVTFWSTSSALGGPSAVPLLVNCSIWFGKAWTPLPIPCSRSLMKMLTETSIWGMPLLTCLHPVQQWLNPSICFWSAFSLEMDVSSSLL